MLTRSTASSLSVVLSTVNLEIANEKTRCLMVKRFERSGKRATINLFGEEINHSTVLGYTFLRKLMRDKHWRNVETKVKNWHMPSPRNW